MTSDGTTMSTAVIGLIVAVVVIVGIYFLIVVAVA